MQRLGRHLVGELFDCVPEILNDLEAVRTVLLTVAGRAQATIVGTTFHQGSPFALSGVVVTDETRLSIHAWPEHRYAAVDLCARDETLGLDAAMDFVIAALAAGRVSVLEVHRAVFPTAPTPGVMAAAGSVPVPHQEESNGSGRSARKS